MIKNKPKKGDIEVFVDDFSNTKGIQPDELLVYVGTVIKNEFTNEKKVGTGVPKKLGVILSELIDNQERLEKQFDELKADYKKNTKILVDVLSVLTSQTELNNMTINELNELKNNKEE